VTIFKVPARRTSQAAKELLGSLQHLPGVAANLPGAPVKGFSGIQRTPGAIGPYVVDFCCYGGKLVVELDGGQHYQQIERDTRRTAFLIKEGYRVIRFSDTDALKNTIAVLEQIRRALYDRHALPSPHPSPARLCRN